MTTMTETDNRSAEQAQAQLDGVRAMVARLEHAWECSGDADECELTDRECYEGLGYVWQPGIVLTDERDTYHDEDAAREAINDDPLSVEVRSGWASPGAELAPEEFQILLCTGGPAVRIMGELDEYGQPERAWIEYQDWFIPWQAWHFDAEDEYASALLTYSAQFYFGG